MEQIQDNTVRCRAMLDLLGLGKYQFLNFFTITSNLSVFIAERIFANWAKVIVLNASPGKISF